MVASRNATATTPHPNQPFRMGHRFMMQRLEKITGYSLPVENPQTAKTSACQDSTDKYINRENTTFYRKGKHNGICKVESTWLHAFASLYLNSNVIQGLFFFLYEPSYHHGWWRQNKQCFYVQKHTWKLLKSNNTKGDSSSHGISTWNCQSSCLWSCLSAFQAKPSIVKSVGLLKN